MRIFLIFILTLFGFSLAHAQRYEGPEADIQQILKNTQAFSAAYVAGDFEPLANRYTEEGKILPPGADIIRGREAIQQRWQLPDVELVSN